MMKKLFAGLALASLALASVTPADAQVSLNLNAPTVDGFASGPLNAATVNSTYVVALNGGQNTVAFAVAGLTASGATVVVEGSADGGQTWYGLNVAQGGTGVLTQFFTVDSTFAVNVAGRTHARLRVSAAGTGSLTVTSNASIAVRDVGIDKPLPAGANKVGSVDLGNLNGAATAAGVAQVATNTKPVTSFSAASVAATLTPGIGIAAVCTAAGNVVFQGSDGSQITVPVNVGFNQFGFAVAKVASQTATCTFTTLS